MEKLKCIKHKLVDAVYDELSKDIHCINTTDTPTVSVEVVLLKQGISQVPISTWIQEVL